jgi:hypothetical protein
VPSDTLVRAATPAEAAAAPAVRTRRRRRMPRPGLPALLGVLALGVYVVAAVLLRTRLHYAIGDSLARSANAKQILFSRDPHLAALGFVWPPFPTLIQLPFVAVLELFGRAELAGPVSTATLAAGSVVVLTRTCRALGLGRTLSVLLVAAYALNPYVVFTAANGMSEASAFFFLALVGYGLVRFARTLSNGGLIAGAVGLAGLVLTRVESVLVVVVVTVAIVLMEWPRRGRYSALVAGAIISLPAAWVFALWLAAQYVIKGDALFFVHAVGFQKATPPSLLHPTLNSSLRYVLFWTVVFSPALVLAVPALLAAGWRRLVTGLALVGSALVFPAVQVVLLMNGTTYGNPRYFSLSIVLGFVACAWLVARIRPVVLRALAGVVAVALLAAGAGLAVLALSGPVVTKTEGEAVVFGRLTHGDVARARDLSQQGRFERWKDVARAIDARLDGDDRVLIDANYSFPAQLYSRHADAFVSNSDRDYEQIVAAGAHDIEYIVAPDPEDRGGLASNDLAYRLTLGSTDWQKVANFGVAAIFRNVNPDSDSAGTP